MKKTKLWIIAAFLFTNFLLIGQPQGFIDQEFVGTFEGAVGLTFDDNGRMYVYERSGKVFIIEDGNKLSTPLLDISDEVGSWRDFGMLGFVLDPNFFSNGYIYCFYIVDRHHLLNFGTSNYNPNTNDYFDATIGRITRYTAEASSNFTTVDYNSRLVLLGENISNDGFANLHQSHGTGSLLFGTDGTLLASFGDGASYNSVDQGSASETYYSQGLQDGIITNAQNIGAYRVQLNNNLAGKLIRIDPATGNGIPSNPYYQSNNPGSAQSKIFAKGLRNPCRMTMRPETGSHDPADANPGAIYIGDVGWGGREELNVVDGPGLNFGWPKWEGMTNQPGYNNNNYLPPSHELAKIDWRNGTARGSINGTIYNIGSSQIPGPSFTGNCSIGGVWYNSDDFPSEWKNSYFHADYGGDWIINFSFDENNNPTGTRSFKSGADGIIFVATDPNFGGIYYLAGASGGSSAGNNAVRKISFSGGNLPPIAIVESDIEYGAGPLTVEFKGDLSYDPNGDNISYSWDFGDGSTSVEANPIHQFSTSNNQATSYNVELTVSDGSLTEQKSIVISLNNTPPQILSTSLDNINTFSHTSSTNIPLNANVSDAEHNNGQLTYEWFTELHHNNHFHSEPADNNPNSTVELTPVGCDGSTYFYRVTLKVTDPAGLSSSIEKNIYPDCGGNTQSISFNALSDVFTYSPEFSLSASASSGLPVIFHVIEGPASISGNTLSLYGTPGMVTVRAIQSGNNSFAPATPIEHSFKVNPATGTGLTGNYYNNINFSNAALTRIDPNINFVWGTGSPDGTIDPNTFSIRWEGGILPIYSENYTFTLTGDDGIRLWVDDQLIIDQWIDQGATAHTGNIVLEAVVQVPIKIEYYENGGAATVKLQWSSNSQAFEIVPKGLLYPEFQAPDIVRPTVSLSTSSNTVTGVFSVGLTFSEPVVGLTTSDLDISNGTANQLSGSDQNYTVQITPNSAGNVSVQLPANVAQDLADNGNDISNLLNITHEPITTGCSSPTNIAAGKITTQSSNYNNSQAGSALAVDGNTSGNWWLDFSVSSTSWQSQPWWEVDLGSISEIQEINIWNRTDCCQENLGNYYILISDNPFPNGNLADLLNQSSVTNFHQTTIAGSPSTIGIQSNGRYVRIINNGAGFMALAEVEVIGCEDGSGPGDTTPPSATVSTVSNTVSSAFVVDIVFNETITGLSLSDLNINNGSATNLVGAGTNYSFSVTPLNEGNVSITLPADRVSDSAGNLNTVSNSLNVDYIENSNGNCSNPVNIALGKPTVHSTDYSNGAGSELAIDGNTSGNWWLDFSVSSTSWSTQPYWEIDLLSNHTIDEIKIWNRTDCCADFMSDYYIFVSSVPFTANTVNDLVSTPGVLSFHQTTAPGTPSAIPLNTTGRYVRIQNSGSGFVALAEVEIMGCLNGNVDSTPPNASLSTITQNVDNSFVLNLNFDESVTGVMNDDLIVSNGTATGLSGSDQTFNTLIVPNQSGQVSITYPQGAAMDLAGNLNNASNTLIVNYDAPPIPTVTITFPTEGIALTGMDVVVDFQTSGDLETYNAEHLLLTLDNNPPIDLHNIATGGTYTFNNVDLGNHTITAQLVDNLHNEINFPESQDIVNFSIIGNGGNCSTLSNLATNGTPSLSSLYNGGGAGPELAIDGNTSGNWFLDYSVASTQWQVYPYWEIDLGESFNIEEIKIWNRTDCCMDFLSNYYVLLSDTPFASDNLNDVLSQSGVTQYHQTTAAGSPSLVSTGETARYVRIQNNTAGFIALAEVEIMGCELPNANGGSNQRYVIHANDNKGIDAVLYPNPVEDFFIVHYDIEKAGELKYFISTTQGQLLEAEEISVEKGEGSIEIDVEDYPAGNYIFFLKLEGFKAKPIPFVKIRD